MDYVTLAGLFKRQRGRDREMETEREIESERETETGTESERESAKSGEISLKISEAPNSNGGLWLSTLACRT